MNRPKFCNEKAPFSQNSVIIDFLENKSIFSMLGLPNMRLWAKLNCCHEILKMFDFW